jgi:hypothetical protein
MRKMLYLSLILNIAVLIPVCTGIALNLSRVVESYGGPTQARGILLSVYFAIGLLSVGLLLRPDPKMVAALLLVQIIYKLLTPITVGTITNPVVVSNILIAAFHSITVFTIFRNEP